MFCAIVSLTVSVLFQVTAKQIPLQFKEKRIDRYEGPACLFGEEFRELGSSWPLDLGPPSGVRYCIQCQCVPTQKKHRIIGKVHCRNVELDCPKPTCDNPVTLPKTCCKVCPEDTEAASEIQNTEPMDESGDAMENDYFVALLSSQTSYAFNRGESLRGVIKLKQDNVATGRFTYYQRNLHYSFYSTSRPQRIQFTDLVGNILEEKTVSPDSAYQNMTNKVCGIWRRISRDYLKMLQEEKILVSLIWDPSRDALTGQLMRSNGLSEELFSVLLESEESVSDKGAGTAIISLQPNSATLHITLLFNGLFTLQDVSSVNVSVKIENPSTNYVFINKVLTVKKPSSEINTLEFNATLSPRLLNILGDQRFSLSVLSKHSSLRLSGRTRQSAACKIYQTVLPVVPSSNSTFKQSNVAGLSWIYLDHANMFHYHVQINGTENVTAVSLVAVQKQVTVRKLRPTLRNGWINGTASNLTPLQLNMLHRGELGISVEGPNGEIISQGKLASKFVTEMMDISSGPSLLTGISSLNAPVNLTGLIWAGFDSECALLFEVELVGQLSLDQTLQLHMEDIPFVAEGSPVKSKLLKEFQTLFVEGLVIDLSDEELLRLSAHLVAFSIQDSKSGLTILRGPWKQISVPVSCLPHSGNTLSLLNYGSDDARTNDIEGNNICFHGDKFHEEGSQWKSSLEPCQMCHCQKSHVECSPFVCPPVTCRFPVKRPGECCPTCLRSSQKQAVTSSNQKCVLGDQMYLPGSSWYPYLPPNGFDTCAVCTCNAITLDVRCLRLKCPPLECDEKMATRPSKTACCKVCPFSRPRTEPPEVLAMMHDEARAEQDKEADIIAAGGCKYMLGKVYKNGEDWHPQIYSQGLFKCILCNCKDGKVKCARKKCSKATCDHECCTSFCQKKAK